MFGLTKILKALFYNLNNKLCMNLLGKQMLDYMKPLNYQYLLGNIIN